MEDYWLVQSEAAHENPPGLDATTEILQQSINIETRSVLQDLRQSIDSINQLSRPYLSFGANESLLSPETQSSALNVSSVGTSDLELSGILERYSDKLLELVADKLVSKMTNK